MFVLKTIGLRLHRRYKELRLRKLEVSLASLSPYAWLPRELDGARTQKLTTTNRERGCMCDVKYFVWWRWDGHKNRIKRTKTKQPPDTDIQLQNRSDFAESTSGRQL